MQTKSITVFSVTLFNRIRIFDKLTIDRFKQISHLLNVWLELLKLLFVWLKSLAFPLLIHNLIFALNSINLSRNFIRGININLSGITKLLWRNWNYRHVYTHPIKSLCLFKLSTIIIIAPAFLIFNIYSHLINFYFNGYLYSTFIYLLFEHNIKNYINEHNGFLQAFLI